MSKWFDVLWQNLYNPRVWPELFRKACNRFTTDRSSPEYLQELNVQARPWLEIVYEMYGDDLATLQPKNGEFDSLVNELQENVERCPVKLGGGAHLRLLYMLTCLGKPGIVLETGVAYGWSSAAILLGLEHNQHGHLLSSDLPYPIVPRAGEYVGWIVPERLRTRWSLSLGPDRQNLPVLLEKVEAIDLFHYDSDKSYSGRMWAFREVWPKLPEGGVLVSDDIQDNGAFHDFCLDQGQVPYVTAYEGKYIGLCRKCVLGLS